MTTGDQQHAQLDADQLIDQVFSLWVLPDIEERGLNLDRDEVYQALVIMKPHQPIEVFLNNDAELEADFEPNRDIAAGEPVYVEDAKEISRLRPREIDPDAGWIAFAFIPGVLRVVAFDFRRYKERASGLLRSARDYLQTAHDALAAARLNPAVENALAAAELSVTALSLLQGMLPPKRYSHNWRDGWLNRYTHWGNASRSHHAAFRRLLQLRPRARYGEQTVETSTDELRQLLGEIDGLISHAAQQASEA